MNDFDLASISAAQARSDRPLQLGGLAIAAIGGIAVVVAIGVSVLRGASARADLALLAGFVFLGAGLFISRVQSKNIRRIRLTPSAVEFVMSSGAIVQVGWDDAALRLELLDRTKVPPLSPALQGRLTPFTIGSRKVGASTDIPRDLYESILDQARQRGKSIQVNHLGPGDFDGAVQSFITQRDR